MRLPGSVDFPHCKVESLRPQGYLVNTVVAHLLFAAQSSLGGLVIFHERTLGFQFLPRPHPSKIVREYAHNPGRLASSQRSTSLITDIGGPQAHGSICQSGALNLGSVSGVLGHGCLH